MDQAYNCVRLHRNGRPGPVPQQNTDKRFCQAAGCLCIYKSNISVAEKCTVLTTGCMSNQPEELHVLECRPAGWCCGRLLALRLTCCRCWCRCKVTKVIAKQAVWVAPLPLLATTTLLALLSLHALGALSALTSTESRTQCCCAARCQRITHDTQDRSLDHSAAVSC